MASTRSTSLCLGEDTEVYGAQTRFSRSTWEAQRGVVGEGCAVTEAASCPQWQETLRNQVTLRL